MPRREAALVYIDPSEWVRFKKTLDQDVFGKTLARDLRKNIKSVGARGVDKVTEKLSEPTPGGNPPGAGLASIAAKMKTQLSFSKSGGGIRWSTSAAGLPVAHKGLLNVYNLSTFNRVDGSKGHGRPYFGSVLFEVADSGMLAELKKALDAANHAIGAKGP